MSDQNFFYGWSSVSERPILKMTDSALTCLRHPTTYRGPLVALTMTKKKLNKNKTFSFFHYNHIAIL